MSKTLKKQSVLTGKNKNTVTDKLDIKNDDDTNPNTSAHNEDDVEVEHEADIEPEHDDDNEEDDSDEDIVEENDEHDDEDEDDDEDELLDKETNTIYTIGDNDVHDDDDNEDDDDDDDDEIKQDNHNLNKTKVTEDSNMNLLDSNYNNDFTGSLDTLLLQKISKDYQNDYIIKNHSHYLNNNIDEIRKLSNVIRNKDNVIIDEFHKTIPFLSKYEQTKIIGIRVKQLNNNAKSYINFNEEEILDNYIIATRELIEKKLPFIIQRPLPNNTFEYWKLNDLDIIS